MEIKWERKKGEQFEIKGVFAEEVGREDEKIQTSLQHQPPRQPLHSTY